MIHAPVRFSIVAALAATDRAEFAYIRDLVEVSDSVLSRQAAVLQDAGYVKISKGFVGKHPRTHLAMTDLGRQALAGHCDALHAITQAAHLTAERSHWHQRTDTNSGAQQRASTARNAHEVHGTSATVLGTA